MVIKGFKIEKLSLDVIYVIVQYKLVYVIEINCT